MAVYWTVFSFWTSIVSFILFLNLNLYFGAIDNSTSLLIIMLVSQTQSCKPLLELIFHNHLVLPPPTCFYYPSVLGQAELLLPLSVVFTVLLIVYSVVKTVQILQ